MLRADKRIGKSLEAHVALFAKDEDTKAALEAVKAIDLPEIFMECSAPLPWPSVTW